MKLNLPNGTSNTFKPALAVLISLIMFTGIGAAQDNAEEILNVGPDAEFDTISDAIEEAEEGDTVSVSPKEDAYNEQVTIDVPDLTLESASEDKNASITSSDGTPVVIQEGGVTVEGFKIEGEDSASAIDIKSDGETDSDDNTVTINGNTLAGYRGTRSDFTGWEEDLIVTGNTFQTDYGITQTEGVESLDVDDNTFEGVAEGIGLSANDEIGEVLAGDETVSDLISDNRFENLDQSVGDRAVNAYHDGVSFDSEGNLVVDDNPSSNENAPGTSIQDAVDFAEEDETVEVESGTYDEKVTVQTEGITFEGPNEGTPGSPEEGSRDDEATIEKGILIEEEGVTLNGLEIGVGDQTSAVDVNKLDESGDPVTVSNSVIRADEEHNGVTINSQGDVDVENNLIENIKNGVFLRDAATDVTVEENRIEEASGFSPDDKWAEGAAIKVVDQSEGINVEVADFTDNTLRNNDLGFWLESNTNDGSDVKKTEPGSKLMSNILEENDFGKSITVRDDPLEEATDETEDELEGSGNLTAVFTEVQDAVDMADEDSKIIVRDGTYRSTDHEEPTVLVHKDVSLVGIDQPNLVYEPDELSGDPVIKVTADDARVEGFDVDRVGHEDRKEDDGPLHYTTQGIRVSASNVVVKDNDVDGESLPGKPSKGIMVLDDESEDKEGEQISSVDVINNTVSGFYAGLSTTNGYGGSISDVNYSYNTIEDNAGHGVNVATRHSDSPEVTIEENEFSSNDGTTLVVYGGSSESIPNADASKIAFTENYVPESSSVVNNGDNSLNAALNYWGQETGPSDSQISGDVVYNPYLTSESALEKDDAGSIVDFGMNMTVPAGETRTVGFPGPMDDSVEEVFEARDEVGVYEYSEGSWEAARSGDEINALDAYVVVNSGDQPVDVSYEFDGDRSGNGMVPGSKQVSEGWNFVTSPQFGEIEYAFQASSAEPSRALNLYEGAVPSDALENDLVDELEFSKHTFGSSPVKHGEIMGSLDEDDLVRLPARPDELEYPVSTPFKGYWVYNNNQEGGEIAANLGPGAKLEEFRKMTTGEYSYSEVDEPSFGIPTFHFPIVDEG